MSRASSLPKRLSYLQSFRRKFKSGAPEELNEDTGTTILFDLLRKRIDGYSAAEAEKLLEDDMAALEEWLSEPEQKNDCLHFVHGLLIVSPSELVKRIQEESDELAGPQLFVEMDLPPGAKVRKDKLISWKGLLVALDAVSGEAATGLAESEAQSDGRVKVCTSSVSFGRVAGTKFLRTGESWRGPFKEVRYVLAVPAGHVCASASPVGKGLDELKWDETKLEAYFHTLRVARKQPVTD